MDNSKLKTNLINTAQNENKQQRNEKNKLVHYISERSSRYGDKLLEFMDKYHITNLQEATVAQLREFAGVMQAQINQERDELVGMISHHSDKYGDRLLEFMDTYHLASLQQATVLQLREFVYKNYLQEQDRYAALYRELDQDLESDRSI